MSQFRKRPVVVEARQYCSVNAQAVAAWCGGRHDGVFHTLTVHTLEGDMVAQSGDWIIRGVKGEFYPCKPDIFDATYEPVEQA